MIINISILKNVLKYIHLDLKLKMLSLVIYNSLIYKMLCIDYIKDKELYKIENTVLANINDYNKNHLYFMLKNNIKIICNIGNILFVKDYIVLDNIIILLIIIKDTNSKNMHISLVGLKNVNQCSHKDVLFNIQLKTISSMFFNDSVKLKLINIKENILNKKNKHYSNIFNLISVSINGNNCYSKLFLVMDYYLNSNLAYLNNTYINFNIINSVDPITLYDISQEVYKYKCFENIFTSDNNYRNNLFINDFLIYDFSFNYKIINEIKIHTFNYIICSIENNKYINFYLLNTIYINCECSKIELRYSFKYICNYNIFDVINKIIDIHKYTKFVNLSYVEFSNKLKSYKSDINNNFKLKKTYKRIVVTTSEKSSIYIFNVFLKKNYDKKGELIIIENCNIDLELVKHAKSNVNSILYIEKLLYMYNTLIFIDYYFNIQYVYYNEKSDEFELLANMNLIKSKENDNYFNIFDSKISINCNILDKNLYSNKLFYHLNCNSSYINLENIEDSCCL